MSFKKRSGSTMRDQNIRIVMEMLKNGMNEKDILTHLSMCFCTDTRVDYLNTAKEMLVFESNDKINKDVKELAEKFRKK